MVYDVSRAYFYALATRNLFIELPREDNEAHGGEAGRLNMCLYGTRDAAKQWQKTSSRHLERIGYTLGGRQSSYLPSARTRNHDIRTWRRQRVVRHDKWLGLDAERAGKQEYDLKATRTRDGVEAETEANILNRIVIKYWKH